MGFGRKILKRLGVQPSSDTSPSPPLVPPHPNAPVWSPAPAQGTASFQGASLIIHPDERDISTDRFNGTYIRLARLYNGTILAGFTWREGGRMDALRILKVSEWSGWTGLFEHVNLRQPWYTHEWISHHVVKSPAASSFDRGPTVKKPAYNVKEEFNPCITSRESHLMAEIVSLAMPP